MGISAYLPVSDEIKDLIEEAFEAEVGIESASKRATSAKLSLGKRLADFEDRRLWQYAQNPDPTTALHTIIEEDDPADCFSIGFGSFDRYLRAQTKPSYSGARAALQAYRQMIDFDMPETVVIQAEDTNLAVIAPELREIQKTRDAAIKEIEAMEELTARERERGILVARTSARAKAGEWYTSAASLSKSDLKTLRGEVKGWTIVKRLIEIEDVPEDERDQFDPERTIYGEYKQPPPEDITEAEEEEYE